MDFPPSFINQIASSNIRKGSIIKCLLNCVKPPKEKYFVVLGIFNEKVGFVFINSEINQSVNHSQELKSLHLLIKTEQYPFLSHNSYVDCCNITVYDRAEIELKISKNLNCIKGEASNFLMNQISEKLLSSTSVSKRMLKNFGLV